jgi:hypothetical protein
MNAKLEKMQQLLVELDDEMEAATATIDGRDFSALELPSIIHEIVGDLQPLLEPYAAAFYWYAFRHSLAKNGDPYVRLSGRHLQSGCVCSPHSVNNKVS